jgi:hypothetical protein
MTSWYDELDLAWRKAPMALAGVALTEALFVLETFALDRNMHVVFSAPSTPQPTSRCSATVQQEPLECVPCAAVLS